MDLIPLSFGIAAEIGRMARELHTPDLLLDNLISMILGRAAELLRGQPESCASLANTDHSGPCS